MFGGHHYDWSSDEEEEKYGVVFYRPDGDTEEKSVAWCISNGFFRVDEGVWSGNWYYNHFPEKRPPTKNIKCPVCGEKFFSEEEKKAHLLESNGKAHLRYVREQGLQEEASEHVKKKEEKEKVESKQRHRQYLEEQRAELLDEVYGCVDCPPSQSAKQRLENVYCDIAELDGTLQICPVCKKRFYRDGEKEDHLANAGGKAHRIYREQNGIERPENFVENLKRKIEAMSDAELFRQVQKPCKKRNYIPPPLRSDALPPGQKDIRTFFGGKKASATKKAQTTSASQSDIRSFFSSNLSRKQS